MFHCCMRIKFAVRCVGDASLYPQALSDCRQAGRPAGCIRKIQDGALNYEQDDFDALDLPC